jgi:hypothetical protein
MSDRLYFQVNPSNNLFQVQEAVRDFVKTLPKQLYGSPVEVSLLAGNNIVPHKADSVPNGFIVIYQDSASNIYDYEKPDRKNLYLNASAPVTIKIVVV